LDGSEDILIELGKFSELKKSGQTQRQLISMISTSMV
jgi:hypothetical protein